MKLGILADIHEEVERLRLALKRCRQEQVSRVVVLGDVFYAGRQIRETVALLADAGAIGVGGNHDLGLCDGPSEQIQARYRGPVLDFMATLMPRLELEGCLFTHGLPHWNATDPTAYYLEPRPETAEGLAGSFATSGHRVLFAGHFHRWLAATPIGLTAWDGNGPIELRLDQRYLVVVAAVCDGWCAVLDTARNDLVPFQL
ncbi:MAG TPA: metallophosphoesterase family protein [Gemmataceae bacterium]|nr:metallophosphoesterase family protein [Gemmataceae bacterium]